MTTPDFPYAYENYPLAPSTLYRVGGPAAVALLPSNESEMQEAYGWMLGQEAPRLILGGGSNVLIADEGFPGVVLFTNRMKQLTPLGQDRYYFGSGLNLSTVVREVMLSFNYEGVGALTGIPGSVGGALYMNAGTVNGSTCDFLESVEILRPSCLETVPMRPDLYSYRGQTFCAQGDVILGGTFKFTPSDDDQETIYRHYIDRRREKQPQGRCCGSVFKNPEGDHAGRLIEACGLKGTRQGGAVISEQHANFIMNDNQATFEDILSLIQLAKRQVQDRFQITLEEEVRVIRVM